MGDVVVVGGGIAGLSAAVRLAQAGVEVTLYEATQRLGGKLRTDHGLESGAEAFLMRDPAGGPSAAVVLAQQLGLGGEIVHPSGLPAGLYINGALRPLPTGTILGIPGPRTDLSGVAAVTSSDVDNGGPVLTADVAVGELVRERLGDEVVAKLVDPLLGGVYAGRADGLSVAATMPGLYQLLRTEHTLGAAVSRVARGGDGPVFGTVVGGLSRLVEAASKRLAELGARVELGEPVRELPQTPAVLAVPGGKARRLLPALDELEYASVALVTLEFAPWELPDLTGFLVPETEGLTIKAATFFAKKWEHIDGTVVRVSIGRAGEAEVLQAPDASLVQVALRDLSKVVGPLPALAHARVHRWGGGLPQYAPGHVDRVASARARLTDRPIALAGAAYDGIGIPACIKSGWQAADLLLQGWLA